MKKILFITTANLSTNPRLLKELKLTISIGLQLEVLAFKQGGWSDRQDEEILTSLPIAVQYLSAKRNPFMPWIISTILQNICIKIYKFWKSNIKVNAYAHNKRSYLLINMLNSMRGDFDLIIAHNLGALYPAYYYAKRKEIPFGFDVEDYHPGELIKHYSLVEKSRREFLMKKLIPKASYVSFASLYIMNSSLDLVSFTNINRPTIINNCFHSSEFKEPSKEQSVPGSPIRLVWFSQNIAPGRGLEIILPAIKKFAEQVELYLIGNLYKSFYSDVLINYSNIYYIEPLSQKKLNIKLSDFDIGLALELNSADYNRQICLTNKIWSYYQTGLFILATNTPAQVDFLKSRKTHGIVSEQTRESMEKAVEYLIDNIHDIKKNKLSRYKSAQNEGWEKEGEKLKLLWESLV